ncbi:MAG: outer membrane lipoprotein carrier protein LolA, partial [Bryobacteraceae bacterium]|nr:outer membrane lipoprotein carrier protein LolA [Bryobacteraceae bacterium]
MRVASLLLPFLAASACGADLAAVLRAVEQRYNRAATLEADFEQRHLVGGRPRRIEAGRLVLRKPGRMRWQYSQPPGKLFVCDGRWVWLYSPEAREVEKARLKETEDFRAPLAFLLGRLDFRRAFGTFEVSEADGALVLRAWPKSDRAPFDRVDFTLGADFAIRRLLVQAPDGTAMEFLFSNERLNV